MRFGGLFGGLYALTEWIMRLAATNLFWLFCSSPAIVIFMMAIFAVDGSTNVILDGKTLFIIVGFMVSAFTYYPATTALYGMARKWVKGDTDVPLMKGYFGFFRENYKQSLKAGLFFAVVFSVFYFNIHFYGLLSSAIAPIMRVLFMVLSVLLVAVAINTSSSIVHMQLSTRAHIKNAALLTIYRLGTTIVQIVWFVIHLAVIGVGISSKDPVLSYLPGVQFFLGASLFVWVSYRLFATMYQKVESKMRVE